MASEADTKKDKVEKPATTFEKPIDVVHAPDLSREEKKKALNTWEQDARQELTASNEGMPGSEEGVKPEEANKLDQVVRAKRQIGEKPQHKPSQ
jgi:hypothetical protein